MIERVELEISWKLAARVWWSFFWRAFLLYIPILLVGGIAFGLISGGFSAMGIKATNYPLVYELIKNAFGLVIITLVNIYVFRGILCKKYDRFRIAVLKKGFYE